MLAARIDNCREAPGGGTGKHFYDEIAQKVQKWQEPPPGKTKKPLPRPDDKPSKKRGGKRHRAMKEKLGLTDVRKETNRMNFAQVRFVRSGLLRWQSLETLHVSSAGRWRIWRHGDGRITWKTFTIGAWKDED